MERQQVLGIFAKWPEAGHVKTRLAAATSAAWAAEVARAFLLDTLERMAGLDARRVLVFTPPSAARQLAPLASCYELIPQVDGSLGQRMASFLARQLQDGTREVVLIGADSPTLPVAYVRQAFAALAQADVVLGPSTDGGYYLLGCRERVPPIFDGISWSGPTVLWETITRLSSPEWRLALLPPWYDVDTLDDWHMLQGHLAALRRAGQPEDAPNTWRLITHPRP
ncbi:MAG: TIGR04282 family arsenosugar biosynthesis glycosyltransferase [Gemmataceae bacterium]